MPWLLAERADDPRRNRAHAGAPGTLGLNDTAQPAHGRTHLVVDHDVVVLGDGPHLAARDLEPALDGRLAVLPAGRDTFAIKEWLAADADARTPKDGSLGNGVIRRGLRASGSSVL